MDRSTVLIDSIDDAFSFILHVRISVINAAGMK